MQQPPASTSGARFRVQSCQDSVGSSGTSGIRERSTTSPTPTASAVDQTADPVDPANETVSIAAPSDGASIAGPQVEVTGAGTAFEGNLRWQALTAGTTDVVQEGFTTAGANGTVGPYAFTVELAPGSYTIEVWEPGESDAGGEGATDGRLGLVTSTFTVS